MPRTPSICLCLLGTTMLACPAAAQEIAETYILDPLVLSAGVDKVASSTPQSVSVVDAEELEEIAPGNIGDIIATVPGVTGVGSSSFFGQGFNIRGFGSSGSAASESGIIQLIDGEEKYYESYRQGALFVEPDFLKRVEVLRGPGASTLYGSGALGGIISMQTIDPGDLIADGQTSGGRVKLGYASNPDTFLGSVAWGWRPTEDFEALAAFAYRKLGDTKDSDGDTIVRANSDTPNLLLKARKTLASNMSSCPTSILRPRATIRTSTRSKARRSASFPAFPAGASATSPPAIRWRGWNGAGTRPITVTSMRP